MAFTPSWAKAWYQFYWRHPGKAIVATGVLGAVTLMMLLLSVMGIAKKERQNTATDIHMITNPETEVEE